MKNTVKWIITKLLLWALPGATEARMSDKLRYPAAYTGTALTLGEPCDARGVYVGVTGDVAVQASRDADVHVFKNVPVGVLPVEAYAVVDDALGPDAVGGEATYSGWSGWKRIMGKALFTFAARTPTGSMLVAPVTTLLSGTKVRLTLRELVPNTIAASYVRAYVGSSYVELAQGSAEATVDIASLSADFTLLSLNPAGDPDGTYEVEVREIVAEGLTTATELLAMR